MIYLDAHNHLHDARLAPHRPELIAELKRMGLERAVVNGTREEDWAEVTRLAMEELFVLPSYGLHPWHVAHRSPEWLDRLRASLESCSRAAVGEVGLDRWIDGHDLAVQVPVLKAQLALAAELERPVTLHCIRAWGALQEVLAEAKLPRGFLVHAFAGSAEVAAELARHGAYFSFSTYFLHERKAAQREVFRRLPLDRLLAETDAPDLRPPDEVNPRPLAAADGSPLNHPANIDLSYRTLAELRGMPTESLAEVVKENFARLFLSS